MNSQETRDRRFRSSPFRPQLRHTSVSYDITASTLLNWECCRSLFLFLVLCLPLSLRCEKPPPLSWTAVSEKTEVTSTHNPILTVSHRQEVLEGKNKVSVWVGGLIIGDRWNEYTRGHTRTQKYSPGMHTSASALSSVELCVPPNIYR